VDGWPATGVHEQWPSQREVAPLAAGGPHDRSAGAPRGAPRGRAADVHAALRRTAQVADLGGVALADPHAGQRSTELVRDDPGERPARAGTAVASAGREQQDRAGHQRHGRDGGVGVVAGDAVLGRHGQAISAPDGAVAGGRCRASRDPAQARRDAATFLVVHEVAQPDLGWAEAESSGGHVHELFDGEVRLRDAVAPVGAGRNGVRGDQ
jgi:hypothetical protein